MRPWEQQQHQQPKQSRRTGGRTDKRVHTLTLIHSAANTLCELNDSSCVQSILWKRLVSVLKSGCHSHIHAHTNTHTQFKFIIRFTANLCTPYPSCHSINQSWFCSSFAVTVAVWTRAFQWTLFEVKEWLFIVVAVVEYTKSDRYLGLFVTIERVLPISEWIVKNVFTLLSFMITLI